MQFYEIPERKCRMHILVYSVGTKATRLKAAVHYASHSLSRGNLKNLMPRFFTFCVPASLMQFQAQLLQNRVYLQYGLSNGKHRQNH